VTALVWKSPFPIRVIRVNLVLHPRRLTLHFTSGSSEAAVSLLAPRDVGTLIDSIEHCAELRLVDINREDGGQMCFGRYRLEVWDEDNRIEAIVVDGFEV
jgi:hypothetical protein